MKNLYYLLATFGCLLLFNCSDSNYISIDSLNTDGDEFYCNQKVKVWLCSSSSDLWHTDYQWTCDGGTFTQPQGLNEMTWKAPNVPGKYYITCKANIGGVTDVRTKEMWVSSYFFEKFEKSPHAFTLQSSNTNALRKEANGNQYLEIKANISSSWNRYIRRTFGDNELSTPFSVRIKMGFISNMPTTQRIIVGTSSDLGMLEYRLVFNQHSSNNNSYISNVRFRWYPCQVTDGYPVEAGNEYNIELRVQYTSPAGVNTSVIERLNLNTLNTFQNGVYKNVSMSVDENEMILINMDGTEILRSSLLKDERTRRGCEGIMQVNYWEIYYPNGNGGMNVPVMYFDDAYASTTEILK